MLYLNYFCVQGLEKAVELGVKEVAVFGAASEAFSHRNINKSIKDSVAVFQEIILEARKHDIRVRGYVSCVLGCPYEGRVDPARVVFMTKQLLDMGCYEVSLGDTTGEPSATMMPPPPRPLPSLAVLHSSCHIICLRLSAMHKF